MRMSRLLVWFQTPKVRTGSVETIGVSLRSTSNMSVLIEVPLAAAARCAWFKIIGSMFPWRS